MITEFFSNPFSVAIVIFVGYYLTTIVDSCNKASVAKEKHRVDAELKRVLAERGMSSTEILEVVSIKVSSQRKKDGASLSDALNATDSPVPPYKVPSMGR